jgi:hypothetical protein
VSPRRSLAWYAAIAVTAAALLWAIPALRGHSLAVPVTYERDGLFFTVLAKAVSEDGLFHATRIGAPFGSDLVDWPLGTWLPLGLIAALVRLTGEPGTAVNLYWLACTVAASLTAAYAFRRLRSEPGPAFVLGLLYGFQPYGFYRNVEHVTLTFPLVPLLALLCLRVAGARPEDETAAERRVTLAACVLQGFCYVYYSFFACLLLVAAAPIGCWRSGGSRAWRRAAGAIAVLALGTAITVMPTLRYWQRNGANPDLAYKSAAETDLYGLKLRHLLTPIAEHPLAPWRALARATEEARFPGENENATARLGTAGALGLLLLLAFCVARAAGLRAGRDPDLEAPAALSLVTLLVSTVGGFASLFALLVSPDVRAFNRVVVFLSFFCLLAIGQAAARTLAPLAARAAGRPWLRHGALAAALLAGIADQVPRRTLETLRAGTEAAFAEERGLVERIERTLPQGALVFQLPAMTIPVDRETWPPMLYYDPARAYVHSRSLRWSWGAILGRDHDWQRAAAILPPAELVRTLALAGFSGIWIDREGYLGDKRPRHEELESALSAAAGSAVGSSLPGRYAFVSIEGYRRRLESELGPEGASRARRAALADAPVLTLERGCEAESRGVDGWWRRCGPSSRLVLRNPRYGELEVTIAARLRSAGVSGARLRLRCAAFRDEVALAAVPLDYRRVVRLANRQVLEIELEASACGADPQPRACFELADLRAATRRIMGGAPVGPPPDADPR